MDFAASDAAMTDEQIAAVDQGVVLLPMTAGEIVVAFNLPGVTELKLPRDVYPEIFLGTITNWNDPKIAAANEGVTLPDMPITVVVRSDSSGTTYNFTNHLSAIDADFKAGPGAGTSVQWPASDKIVKAPKNDGITATVMQTPGAIGYIEYGYGKLTGTPMAILQNAAGEYVAPGGTGGAEALASATFDDHMRAFITDPAGQDRLSDRDLHLDGLLRARPGRDQGRGDQGDGRVRPDRGPGDGRRSRLHPDARGGHREGPRRGGGHRRRRLIAPSLRDDTAAGVPGGLAPSRGP